LLAAFTTLAAVYAGEVDFLELSAVNTAAKVNTAGSRNMRLRMEES
jgi:hypothetical protein